MGGDRGGYDEWHLNFVNTITQVRPGIRGLLQALETTNDEEFGENEFDLWADDADTKRMYQQWNSDLWWVLVGKTSSEALMRVKGTVQGEGVEAYRKLHQWCARHTTMTMQELRTKVMRPNPAKNEAEVAQR